MKKTIIAIGLSASALAAVVFALKKLRKPHRKSMTFREIYEDNFREEWAG